MTLAQVRRAAAVAVTVAAALALAGCANLPFMNGKTNDQTPGARPAATIDHAEYRLEVEAPEPLRKLLTNYLDLARFQFAPATEGIDAAELERLMRAAPAQARGLLETEGYFNAEVRVERAGSDAGVPLLKVIVNPGPRTTVAAFTLEATGALQSAAAAGDAAALRELAALRALWPMRSGDVFRQTGWSDAKNSTLARLRADGYAAAGWASTSARVDAPANRATLALVFDSGPLYRLGPIRIEGLERYDEDTVRRLATFNAGDAYNEKALLDFQERLQKLGLFEGASVELVADVETAAAAPVLVRVKEQALQQATIGVGYSANTGARLAVEHTHRRVFGSRWVAKNKLRLGPDEQAWEGELTSHPLAGLYRNLVSASASRLRAADQVLLSGNARLGRAQDTPRIERLYFGEVTRSRLDSDALTSQGDAASFNYHWIYRDLDNVLLPTRGLTVSAQAALGYARGSRQRISEALEEARGPFARLYTRLTWYRPLGSNWYGSARIEAGQVFTGNVIGIPDTVLFRAGGDDSVRGYGYRTLGPTIDGVTTSGRNLLTGSVEVARPISARYPDYWWAAFIDAGNAANRWTDLKPAFGYGVGLRWRSPVGPLRVDLAYGQQVRKVQVHLSVGVTF